MLGQSRVIVSAIWLLTFIELAIFPFSSGCAVNDFSVFERSGGPYSATSSIRKTASPGQGAGVLFYRRFEKRVFDLVFAIMLLPVLIPVIFVLWVMVRIDGGPGFFGQTRVGRNGVLFTCWKLRTMQTNAETALRRYLAQNPAARLEWEQDQKLRIDPRVTPFGRFLRRTSLDELPQILNVLLGNMSFVGPRPIVILEIQRYGAHKSAYLSGKPGITGLWQVSGRNSVKYDERVSLDLAYREMASFWLDLRIILKTALVVVRPTGQ